MRIGGDTCLRAGLALAIGLVPAVGLRADTTVVFSNSAPVDLGSNLDTLADLDPWSYTLGTDWDEDFTLGGIIGSPNTTIIPEVKAFGTVIIPEVKADTRTGARMTGRVWGDVGLEFSADFIASGLEPGVGFDFAPTLSHPTTPEAGSFFKFETATGVGTNPGFTEEDLQLPAVDAQIDFFFNLDVTSRIDYGLFPIVGYNSVPFNPGGIHLDQRDDPDKSLLRFQASLDPDDNNGNPLPPTFTAFEGVEVLGIPLEQQIGQLDDGEFLASKQFSTNVEQKDMPNAPKNRIDLGEIQVVNPFGTGGDLLGNSPNRNLEIGTSIADDSIGFTTETALFRMGLDLDGIAAGLATGQSFTRIEEDIKIGNTKIAEIVADLIDLKYGPEVGFRESVEINPEFNVTVSFLDANTGLPVDVALDDDGSVSLMSSYQGNWGDLPEIALLTADPVDVEVSFDELTGDQNKRGVFFLTDYLEFTLLELESLNILDTVDLSLPPLFRTRTSLLGDLLGELELEAYTDSEAISPFALNGEIPTQSFTITPAPTVLAYLTSGGEFDPRNPGAKLRKLDGHTPVSSSGLPMVTLVVGQGDATVQSVADFTPIDVVDNGAYVDSNELLEHIGIPPDAVSITEYDDATQVTESWGIHVIEGSTYEQFGSRTWELPTVRNDGLYHGRGQMTTFQNPGGTLFISGDGMIEIEQHARIEGTVIIHGQGHTLRLDTATGYDLVQGPLEDIDYDDGSSSGVQTATVRLPDQVVEADRFIDADNIFINAGTLDLFGARGEIYAGMEFDNAATGVVDFVGDGNLLNNTEVIAITTPSVTNNGLISVGSGARMSLRTTAGSFVQELRGDGTIRVDGGQLRILQNVTAYAPDGATDADAAAQTFDVVNGGSLNFLGTAQFYAKPTFNIDATSNVTMNGLLLDDTNILESRFGPGAPIQVNNAGTLQFLSGDNSFRLATNEINTPGQEPTVIPIGLDNTGTVIIRHDGTGFVGTRVFLDAEIQDYAEGGATFNAGAWEIIGATPSGTFSNLGSASETFASLLLRVDRVKDGENYLSIIDPGQPGGSSDGFADDYDVNDYDTFMSANRSDITLSGRARFAYLDTVQTNHGTLTFDNLNEFVTAGDLTNTGTINLTNGGRLTLSGGLLVDGGAINVDATSTLDGGTHSIDVVGGTINLNKPVGPANLNTSYTVRERTLVDAQGNVTQIIPGVVDFGGATFPTIGANADIVVAGETAVFTGLTALSRIEGSLTLDGGQDLTLDQALETTSTGELNVLGGSQLVVNGNFLQSGSLTVGADSYALVGGTFSTTVNSTTHIDGVLEAAQLDIAEDALLTGAGRVSGGIYVQGELNPGNSPGTIQTFGSYIQDSQGTLTLDLLGPDAGEDHDQVLAKTAVLFGTLNLAAGPDVLTTAYGKELDIIVTDDGYIGQFDEILNQQIDADHQWVFLFESTRVSVVASLIGDANFNGQIEQGDLDAVLQNWGSTDVTWETGDFNGNGQVEQGDLDAVLQRWGLNDAYWTSGDLNNSGQVEQGDLDAVLQNWGSTDRVWFGAGDLNGNGQVEQGDLDIILQNWGSTAAPDFRGVDVPEPTIGLVVLAGLITARRRPR